MDFAVPGDHRVKLKESEKKDKYLDLWNMKVMLKPIVVGPIYQPLRSGRIWHKVNF